jgi:endoglucanase
VDFPPEVIFEVMNEPNSQLNARRWNDFQLAAVETIRETNPDRRIVIGPTQWNSVWQLHTLELPEDTSNLIATFHNYEPFEFTHQGAEWVNGSNAWLGWTWTDMSFERDDMRELFDIAATWSTDNGDLPVLMGEFGAYSKADLESRLLWTRAVVEEAEAREIGWCYWEWAAGFGIYDRNRREFNEIYRALIPEETG